MTVPMDDDGGETVRRAAGDEPLASRPPRPIAVVDDEPIIRRVVASCLRGKGFTVAEFADGRSVMSEPADGFAAVCLDLGLGEMSGLDVLRHFRTEAPDVPVIIMSAGNTLDAAVEAMRLGAYDYLSKPIDRERLLHSLGRALERVELSRRANVLSAELAVRRAGDQLIGSSAAMRSVLEQLGQILQSDVPVCLLGESGTGKEVVARTIHQQGRRQNGPFIAINCASIPDQLQESELFGHERGAFTGATNTHLGCFERAEGGTLLLDELGDMHLSTQAKLLRALQEKTIRRVGGAKDIRTDVRVVAATHKDLFAEARAGRFREDLFFRLMVYPIEIPPLRDRKDDIPVLVGHFLKRLRDDVGRPIERMSADAMDALMAHAWPGNVRELQNAVHRAMLTCATNEVQFGDLPPHLRRRGMPAPASGPSSSTTHGGVAGLPTLILRDLERLAIDEALARAGGAIQKAAKLLGIGRATLYRRLVERSAAEGRNPDDLTER